MKVSWSFSPVLVTFNDLVILRSISPLLFATHAFIVKIPGGLTVRPQRFNEVLRTSYFSGVVRMFISLRWDALDWRIFNAPVVSCGRGLLFSFV